MLARNSMLSGASRLFSGRGRPSASGAPATPEDMSDISEDETDIQHNHHLIQNGGDRDHRRGGGVEQDDHYIGSGGSGNSSSKGSSGSGHSIGASGGGGGGGGGVGGRQGLSLGIGSSAKASPLARSVSSADDSGGVGSSGRAAPGRKEQWLVEMNRKDGEIAEAKRELANFKVRREALQAELERERHRKTLGLAEEDMAAEETMRGLIKRIYGENAAAVQRTVPTAMRTPSTSAPCRPQDYAVVRDVLQRSRRFLPALQRKLGAQLREDNAHGAHLCASYARRMATWRAKRDREASRGGRKAQAAAKREGYFESQFPGELRHKPTPDNVGDSGATTARALSRSRGGSDAELEHALRESMLAEQMDPEIQAYLDVSATPSMQLTGHAYRLAGRLINRNGLIDDPRATHEEVDRINVWTPEEEEIFFNQYMLHPKRFHRIAYSLPNKSCADCVKYYYRSKKQRDYKGLREQLRKAKSRRKRARSRASREPAATRAVNEAKAEATLAMVAAAAVGTSVSGPVTSRAALAAKATAEAAAANALAVAAAVAAAKVEEHTTTTKQRELPAVEVKKEELVDPKPEPDPEPEPEPEPTPKSLVDEQQQELRQARQSQEEEEDKLVNVAPPGPIGEEDKQEEEKGKGESEVPKEEDNKKKKKAKDGEEECNTGAKVTQAVKVKHEPTCEALASVESSAPSLPAPKNDDTTTTTTNTSAVAALSHATTEKITASTAPATTATSDDSAPPVAERRKQRSKEEEGEEEDPSDKALLAPPQAKRAKVTPPQSIGNATIETQSSEPQ